MSDCEKCCDTPCSCGYGYTHMTEEQFDTYITEIVKGREEYLKKTRDPTMYLKEKECPLCGIRAFRI